MQFPESFSSHLCPHAHPKFPFSKSCPFFNLLSLYPAVTSHIHLPATLCAISTPILPSASSQFYPFSILSVFCFTHPPFHLPSILHRLRAPYLPFCLSSVLPVHLPRALGAQTDIKH